MTGGMEAAADIATGALWAHAVEPRTGETGHGGHADLVCLNCGTRLAGDYCHACGQPAHVHRSLSAIWHDLAHGAFHFEGKIWHTLPMLVARPGELTRRYVAGERARFVSPLALFLFTMFLAFLMLTVAGAHLETPDVTGGARAQTEAGFDRASAKRGDELAALGRQRAALQARGADLADIDDAIANKRREISSIDAVRRTTEIAGGEHWSGDVHTGWHRLDHGIKAAAENPNLLLYKLQSNAYKYSWALIPLSLPFLWLLFPFSRRFGMYDHAVFVTYSLSFMSLLVIVLSVASAIGLGPGIVSAAALIAPPVHLYRQLRGAYRCGRIAALARTAALLVAAFLTLTAFIVLLIGLGLVG